MELRLIDGEDGREIFATRLATARERLGIQFKERPRSRLAQIQLRFGMLYGLFEHERDSSDQMLAGLAMHDLEMFPQTCRTPDLSRFPASSVIEISDLWSLSRGAGFLAWCAAGVAARRLGARALLAYLAVGRSDNAAFYTRTGFLKVGEPVEYAFVHTLDGDPIRVQPMVLKGEPLKRLLDNLDELALESTDPARIVFKDSVRIRSAFRPFSFAAHRPQFEPADSDAWHTNVHA